MRLNKCLQWQQLSGCFPHFKNGDVKIKFPALAFVLTVVACAHKPPMPSRAKRQSTGKSAASRRGRGAATPARLCGCCQKGFLWQKESRSKFHKNDKPPPTKRNCPQQGNFQGSQPQAPQIMGASVNPFVPELVHPREHRTGPQSHYLSPDSPPVTVPTGVPVRLPTGTNFRQKLYLPTRDTSNSRSY